MPLLLPGNPEIGAVRLSDCLALLILVGAGLKGVLVLDDVVRTRAALFRLGMLGWTCREDVVRGE